MNQCTIKLAGLAHCATKLAGLVSQCTTKLAGLDDGRCKLCQMNLFHLVATVTS